MRRTFQKLRDSATDEQTAVASQSESQLLRLKQVIQNLVHRCNNSCFKLVGIMLSIHKSKSCTNTQGFPQEIKFNRAPV